METTQGETKMNPQEIDTQIQDKRIELGKLFDKEGRTILSAINSLSWVRDQFDSRTDELTEVGQELRDAFFGTYRGNNAGYWFQVSGSDRAGVVNAKIRAFGIVENNNPEVVSEKLSAVRAEIAELEAEIAELNGSYTGCTRWELCLGGHLHKCTQGARCHSLDKGVSGRSMTAWLPQFSGMEWTEVASQLGDATVVCSHCVPEAPVEYHTKREEESAKVRDNFQSKANHAKDTTQGLSHLPSLRKENRRKRTNGSEAQSRIRVLIRQG